MKKLFFRVKDFFKAVRFVQKHGSATVLRDGGTGLFTKAVFTEMALGALKSAMRTKTPISLIMADMDGLKEINSLLGHQGGDSYLRKSAKIFMDTLRESDVVGRYGGDEFIAILPGANKAQAITVVNKLKERLNEEKTGWSFGVAEAQFPDKSVLFGSNKEHLRKGWEMFLQNLIAEADDGMYRDKAKRVEQFTSGT